MFTCTPIRPADLRAAPGGAARPWAPFQHTAPAREGARLTPQQDHLGRPGEPFGLLRAVSHANGGQNGVALSEGCGGCQQTLGSLFFELLHQRQTGVLGSRTWIQHLIHGHGHGLEFPTPLLLGDQHSPERCGNTSEIAWIRDLLMPDPLSPGHRGGASEVMHWLIARAVPAAGRLARTTPEKGVAAIADPKAEPQGFQQWRQLATMPRVAERANARIGCSDASSGSQLPCKRLIGAWPSRAARGRWNQRRMP